MINIEKISDHAYSITVMAEFRQADAERLVEFAKERNKEGGGGNVLIDLTAASDISLSAVTVELAHIPTLLKWVYGLDRIAIVSDDDWVRTAARVESAMLPGVTYAVYDEDEAEAARKWVLEEADTPHKGAFRELDIGKTDIAAFEVTGRLDRAESERGVALARAKLVDPACDKLMIAIKNWHGFDADAMLSPEIMRGKLDLMRKLKRYAIVGGPAWTHRIAEIVGPLVGIEIKTFDEDEEDKAIVWLEG
ncbi:STAS/SEC14 domain-containing protein [Erythrobacter sp. THAF29]|uniref:STAS/SEC14 domain-containing protein n=1 Tax=Erythrobacter sp. THAF29 TaxID=2587851 RepID=UPI0012693475|nr:STAS/SEC14 domain-containing protein [Erythrobacter sp. THAF29]QFT76440.1 hypothetical protein FIU90_02675 [Erythrobacter sp. THAF29]